MSYADDRVVIEDGPLRVIVDTEDGARISSLVFNGMQMLRTTPQGNDPISYGSYPMAPYAGRIAAGRLQFDEEIFQLPLRNGEHALHGNVLDRAWTYIGTNENGAHGFVIKNDERWPFNFLLSQIVQVENSTLTLTLRMESDVAQPAWVGWHPWWLRHLDRGEEVQLTLPASTMLERVNMIPTGRRIEPTPGPWDDTFTDLRGPVVLEWPHAARVTMNAGNWVVVYSHEDDAICVEPQSGPPNAQALGAAHIVGPGTPLEFTTTWSVEEA